MVNDVRSEQWVCHPVAIVHKTIYFKFNILLTIASKSIAHLFPSR